MNNLLVVVLDSCRYDTFLMAEKPNIESIKGELYKVYSPASYTPPSMLAYSLGTPPLNAPLKYRKTLFLRREYFDIPFHHNAIFTPNPLIIRYKNIFKGFDTIQGLQYDYIHSSKEIFQDAVDYIKSKKDFRVFMLVMETHSPFWDGKKKWDIFNIPTREQFLEVQSKSVTSVDQNLPILLDNIPKDTRLIITADHGELYDKNEKGEMIYHHNLTYNNIEFHKKLFEIPLLIKNIK